MAVYERRYQPYYGPLKTRRQRLLVIPAFNLTAAVGKRRFIALYLASLSPILLAALVLYLPHNTTLLEYTDIPLKLVERLIKDIFGIFLRVEAGFAVLIFLSIRPAPLGEDLRANALPLYFSRSMRRADYLWGNTLTALIPLSLNSWIAGLFLFGLQTSLSGFGWALEHARLAFGIIAAGWLYSALLISMGLAISALVRSPTLTAAAMLGSLLLGAAVGASINTMLDVTWGFYLDVFKLLTITFAFLLDPEAHTREVPGPMAIFALIGYIFLWIALLFHQIKPKEGKA